MIAKDVKMRCPHCGWWNPAGIQTGKTRTVFYCFNCGQNVVGQTKSAAEPKYERSSIHLENSNHSLSPVFMDSYPPREISVSAPSPVKKKKLKLALVLAIGAIFIFVLMLFFAGPVSWYANWNAANNASPKPASPAASWNTGNSASPKPASPAASQNGIAAWDNGAVCSLALNVVRTNWDEEYSQYIGEAQRRGLSVEQCRLALGLSVSPTPPPPQAP